MGLNETIGIEVGTSSAEGAVGTMPIGPGVLQPYGFLHGGATIALLEAVASAAAAHHADLETERPFGVDVHVRHRKSGRAGVLTGIAELDHVEPSQVGMKQFWRVRAIDDEGDVISDGTVMTKVVSLAYLEQRERSRTP